MEERAKPAVRIDLAQFKLHVRLKSKTEVTLHFDSPSRRFYLSVIALVVREMQRLRQVTSIPLETHATELALLNETVGGAAGSSERESLTTRVYRKWKGALPDLENAPLFKVIGRKKEEDASGRTYRFSEAEKDTWANLFEYKGSEEHVRLRFSIDSLGAGLDDAVLVYEDSRNGEAWERFVASLTKSRFWSPPSQFPKPLRLRRHRGCKGAPGSSSVTAVQPLSPCWQSSWALHPMPRGTPMGVRATAHPSIRWPFPRPINPQSPSCLLRA